MRLLLVSDLHYSLPQLDWVVAVAERFDSVVIAGDLLDISSAVEPDAQVVVVLKYLELLQERTTVVVSSGNHDLVGPDADGEQAALWLDAARAAGIAVDGDTIELGDDIVSVCAWWDGPLGRQRVDAQLARDAARRRGRWIWVYHWPPTDSPTAWTGSNFYGDPDLRRWIDRWQPDLVLSGHVHQPPFQRDGSWADRIGATWVFNPGRQIGPVPTCIEIDLDSGRAEWWSLLGSEQMALADVGPPARSVI